MEQCRQILAWRTRTARGRARDRPAALAFCRRRIRHVGRRAERPAGAQAGRQRRVRTSAYLGLQRVLAAATRSVTVDGRFSWRERRFARTPS